MSTSQKYLVGGSTDFTGETADVTSSRAVGRSGTNALRGNSFGDDKANEYSDGLLGGHDAKHAWYDAVDQVSSGNASRSKIILKLNAMKTSIFQMMFFNSYGQIISPFIGGLICLIEFLQLLDFVLRLETFNFHSVTLNWLKQATSVLTLRHTAFFMENWTVLLAYIHTWLTLFVLIYIHSKIKSTEFNDYNVVNWILRRTVPAFPIVFFIPYFSIFMELFRCEALELTHNNIWARDTCGSISHIIFTLTSIPSAILLVIMTFFILITHVDFSPSSLSVLSMSQSRVEQFKMFISIILCIVFGPLSYIDSTKPLIMSILMFVCFGLMVTFRLIYLPHYRFRWCLTFIARDVALAWCALMTTISTTQNNSHFLGASIGLLWSTPFIVLAFMIIAQTRRWSITMQHPADITSAYFLELYIRFVMSRIHKHLYTPSYLHKRRFTLSQYESVIKTCEEIYKKAVVTLARSDMTFLFYAQFAFEFRGNYHCTHRYSTRAESMAVLLDAQYQIYKIKQLIDMHYQARLENREILNYIAYEHHTMIASKHDAAASKTQLQFWTMLAKPKPDVGKLNHLANSIAHHNKLALQNYRRVLEINPNSSQCMRMYASFLLDVMQDKQLAQQQLDMAQYADETSRNSTKSFGSYRNNQKSLFDENNAIIVISGDDADLGVINKINTRASEIFNYNQGDFLGKHCSKLFTEPFSTILSHYIYSFQDEGHPLDAIPDTFMMCKHSTGYIFPAFMQIRKFVEDGHMRLLVILEHVNSPSPICSVIVHDNGYINAVSANAAALFGLDLNKVSMPRGVHMSSVIPNYTATLWRPLKDAHSKIVYQELIDGSIFVDDGKSANEYIMVNEVNKTHYNTTHINSKNSSIQYTFNTCAFVNNEEDPFLHNDEKKNNKELRGLSVNPYIKQAVLPVHPHKVARNKDKNPYTSSIPTQPSITVNYFPPNRPESWQLVVQKIHMPLCTLPLSLLVIMPRPKPLLFPELVISNKNEMPMPTPLHASSGPVILDDVNASVASVNRHPIFTFDDSMDVDKSAHLPPLVERSMDTSFYDQGEHNISSVQSPVKRGGEMEMSDLGSRSPVALKHGGGAAAATQGEKRLFAGGKISDLKKNQKTNPDSEWNNEPSKSKTKQDADELEHEEYDEKMNTKNLDIMDDDDDDEDNEGIKISDRLRKEVLQDNEGIVKGLHKFQCIFLSSVLIVVACALALFLVTVILLNQFQTNLEFLNEVTNRSHHFTEISLSALIGAFMSYNLIDPNAPSPYSTAMSDTGLVYGVTAETFLREQLTHNGKGLEALSVSLTSAIQAAVASWKSSGASTVKGSYVKQRTIDAYINTPLQVNMVHITTNEVYTVQKSMMDITNMAISQSVFLSQGPLMYFSPFITSVFFLSSNVYSPDIIALEETLTDLTDDDTCKTINLLHYIIIALVISPILCLFLVIIFILRPTVSEIEESKSQVILVFLDIPTNIVLQLKQIYTNRVDTFSSLGSAAITVNDDEDDDTFKDMDDDEDGERGNKIVPFNGAKLAGDADKKNDQMSFSSHQHIFLLKIALVFIVSLVYFLIIYFTGIYTITPRLHNTHRELTIASLRKGALATSLYDTFSISTFSPTLAPMFPQSWTQPAYGRDAITSTYRFHTALMYGDTALDIKLPSSTDSKMTELLTGNSCVPSDNSYCRTFNGGIMMRGLNAAVTEFIQRVEHVYMSSLNAIKSIYDSANPPANTFKYPYPVSLPDPTVITNTQPASELMMLVEWLQMFLMKALDMNSTLYLSSNDNQIQNMVITELILLLVFSAVSFSIYIFVYIPLIHQLDTQIKRTRSMLLMIPADVLEAIPAAKLILQNKQTVL